MIINSLRGSDQVVRSCKLEKIWPTGWSHCLPLFEWRAKSPAGAAGLIIFFNLIGAAFCLKLPLDSASSPMKFIALKLCRSGGSPSIFKGIEAHSFMLFCWGHRGNFRPGVLTEYGARSFSLFVTAEGYQEMVEWQCSIALASITDDHWARSSIVF